MVTREQIDQEIEVKNNKDFWSDDTCKKEGLQSRCEGLSVFLLQGLDAPEKVEQYLSTERIKQEINAIHKTVMGEGFIPKPYEFCQALEDDQIEPPEFSDTVTFVLWCSIISRNVLLRTKKLDEETKQKTDQLIDKSIDWLIDTHISKQGWSGFRNKTSSFIYSTWTVANCVDAFEILEETATDNTRKLMEKLKGKLNETREWLARFAGKQTDEEWESDPARIGGRKIGYGVYGLDMLTSLRVHETQPQLLIDLTMLLNEAWNNSEARFYKDAGVHLLRARNEGEEGEAADISYDDDSGLLMGLMALSKASRVLRDELSRTDSYDNITKTLEEMFSQLKDPEEGFYDRGGLWVDCEKRFSIYMTQRAIEALIEYKKSLPRPPVDMNLINGKIDELLRVVRKMDINVGKLLDDKALVDDVGRALDDFQNELPKKKKE